MVCFTIELPKGRNSFETKSCSESVYILALIDERDEIHVRREVNYIKRESIEFLKRCKNIDFGVL